MSVFYGLWRVRDGWLVLYDENEELASGPTPEAALRAALEGEDAG